MKYKQLTQEIRYQISAMIKSGYSKSEVAREVKISRTTVYRELKRNSKNGNYEPYLAHTNALERRKKPQRKSKFADQELALFIKQKLSEGWSPEQISGYNKRNGLMQISHEAIYQYIEADRRQGGLLFMYLRCRKKRRKKLFGSRNTYGQIKDRISIDQMPRIVDEKARIGDWEIDTVIGKGHKGVLVTVVERLSKLTLIAKSANKTADSVTKAVIELLTPIKEMVHTITVDNGKEFSKHTDIATALGAKVYFAHPYHSWERGLNENTNGLIRQYFPKKMRLDDVTESEIKDVITKLNTRPRKTLEFAVPIDKFSNGFIERCY